jgi:hypothetical protein
MREVNKSHAMRPTQFSFSLIAQLCLVEPCLATESPDRPEMLLTLVFDGKTQGRDINIESLVSEPVRVCFSDNFLLSKEHTL